VIPLNDSMLSLKWFKVNESVTSLNKPLWIITNYTVKCLKVILLNESPQMIKNKHIKWLAMAQSDHLKGVVHF